jgi:flavin-dependent dehydrogenase
MGHDAEAIVVGGGPAGSVTAMLLAERGHRVLLLDKAHFPRHKACSEYVNPAGVGILTQLGFASDLDAVGAHNVAGMLIHAPGGARFLIDFASAAAGRLPPPVEIPPPGRGRLPSRPGGAWGRDIGRGQGSGGSHALGLSRYRLDAILLDGARAAGVEVREGAHVRAVLIDAGRVSGVEATIDGGQETLRAPLTIGADGRFGVVSRALGLDVLPRWPRRIGLVAHYRGVTGLDRCGELHVARHGYSGLAPLEDGLTNVAFVTSSAAIASRGSSLDDFFLAGLGAIPAVAAKLDGAQRVGTIRGVGPMAHRARRVVGDGFLLIGDAAGFLDPFTGDGICEALHGALLAAPVADAALRAGDLSAQSLEPYRDARRQAFDARRKVGWLVQGFISAPPLMDYSSARLTRRPGVAMTLAGVLGGLYPAQEALSPAYLARLLRP